jgi:hypothetical protein
VTDQASIPPILAQTGTPGPKPVNAGQMQHAAVAMPVYAWRVHDDVNLFQVIP